MNTLRHTVLYTDAHGFARFREENIALPESTPRTQLSAVFASPGFQWRHSPPGASSDFHCTTTPQWLVVLAGAMEIGLRDGTVRVFRAGEYFFSNDLLPAGTAFNPAVHGHRSRVLGDAPLSTLFVRTAG